MVKRRLPWLLIGLAGGILAAWILGFFEELLTEKVILAMFIPVIAYMSNAVGIQTQTLFIRDIALEKELPWKKYIFRQLTSCLIIGLICSAVFFAVVLLGWDTWLGFVLGVSMLITIMVASFWSLFIPRLLYKMKVDPALGSGPFATVVQDILSIIIYFAIASWLL